MTFQVRETVIYRGEKRQVRALPLTGCERQVPEFGVISSGCWRGYEGTWELNNDLLYLIKLAGPHGHGNQEGLAEMFPDHKGPVEADWFSGEVVPDDVFDPEVYFQVDLFPVGDPRLWFEVVVHRGKLLLETSVDLKDGVTHSRLTKHVEELFPGPEAAFLHSIHENAEDHTPRQVYADWLEERGEPRARWLRAEVERLRKEGPRKRWAEMNDSWGIPSGSVPPENLAWFWCRLATGGGDGPEARELRAFFDSLDRA